MFAVHKPELLQVFNTFKPCFFQLCQVIFIIQALQDLFVTCFGRSVFLVKIMQDVTHTHSVTAYLIRISGADTLTGSSHFSIALCSFVCGIQNTVRRQNEMCFLRNMQAFLQVVAGCFQRLRLCFEQRRIEHHAVTDYIHFITLKNSRRNGTEHILLAFKLQCMAGVRAALKTCHYIVSRS